MRIILFNKHGDGPVNSNGSYVWLITKCWNPITLSANYTFFVHHVCKNINNVIKINSFGSAYICTFSPNFVFCHSCHHVDLTKVCKSGPFNKLWYLIVAAGREFHRTNVWNMTHIRASCEFICEACILRQYRPLCTAMFVPLDYLSTFFCFYMNWQNLEWSVRSMRCLNVDVFAKLSPSFKSSIAWRLS